MRISDWSSDVCSSDLAAQGFRQLDAHLSRIGIPSVVHQCLRGTLGRSVFLTQQRGETGINLESKICGTHGWLLLRYPMQMVVRLVHRFRDQVSTHANTRKSFFK